MRLSFHGGMCCGIKHIYEMGENPGYQLPPLEDISQAGRRLMGLACARHDVLYEYCDQEERVMLTGAPAQTYEERLDHYLNFLREWRPRGIVEISLITPGGSDYSQHLWVPIIEKRGFVEVTPEGGVPNSNSGNKVRVFHLYMGM